MRDDLTTSGLLFLMGLLSFPISLIAAPVSLGLSFAIVGAIYLLFGQFTDVRQLSPFLESAFIFYFGSECSFADTGNGFAFRGGLAIVPEQPENSISDF
jgi:hypothetical protein